MFSVAALVIIGWMMLILSRLVRNRTRALPTATLLLIPSLDSAILELVLTVLSILWARKVAVLSIV